MIYCMSDIHGELDRFKAMLDLINFSSDDTLYIIGDVIDRHPGGVEILKIIKDTPNMFMLLGNHEQMCLDTLGPNSVYGSRRLWLENGGSNTYEAKKQEAHINSVDERKQYLRMKAGHITYQIMTLLLLILSLILALIRVDVWVIAMIFLLFVVQWVIGIIVYRILEKKM